MKILFLIVLSPTLCFLTLTLEILAGMSAKGEISRACDFVQRNFGSLVNIWIIERLDRKRMSKRTSKRIRHADFLSPIGWFMLQDGVSWFHHSGNLWRNDGENVAQTSRNASTGFTL